MERIRLTREEKKVLEHLYNYGEKSIDDFSRNGISYTLRMLENKGLVKVAWIDGGNFEAVRLTDFGRYYVRNNPNLSNPVDWNKIGVISGIVAAIAAVAALLIGCSILTCI